MSVRKDEKKTQSARDAVTRWRDYFQENINQYHAMHDFVLGKQWQDDEAKLLTDYGKVPLQFNKLATLTNSLLGEQQQNTPQLEVVPLAECDAQTASIRESVIKDIMLSTETKTVYQVAAAQAFIGGFGAFYLDTEYEHEKSFDQCVVYRHLKDATRAYWDVSAEETSKIDGMHAGYLTRMNRTKFKQLYGEIAEDIFSDSGIDEQQESSSNTLVDEDAFCWADKEGVTILHHFEREFKNETLYRLSNGKTLTQAELDDLSEQSRATALELGDMEADSEIIPLYDEGLLVRIEQTRDTTTSIIKHYLIAGDYILDETEFPSQDLPVIFVDQNSYFDKTGNQVCRPFVIDAIDAQRYVNYLGTHSAYILKISRYDQFMGSKNNIKSQDTAEIWRNPHLIQGMLPYDESPSGAKPEQIRPPELSQSLIQQYQRAIEDMYTSTGLYPTRLGQQGNEVSGAAIDARTRQGSYSTFVAFNAINRAITAGGRILNQMVPRVYDTERTLSLILPDAGRQNVIINQQTDAYGELIQNDLKKGIYEVRLQAGPSYEGQKAQALESLNMLLQANPQLLNLIADLYAENLPLSNTVEIKNRLKTIVPKAILEAGKTGQLPNETQAPNAQEQAIMAEIKNKQQQLELKKQELMLRMQEAESKNQQAMLELEMKKLELLGDIEVQKLRYLAETDRTASNNAIAHADNITEILTTQIKGM